MRIAVIGAGAIGANVAYRLQEQGAQVTLIDASRPGSGTSGTSMSWFSSFPQRAWEEEVGKATLRRQLEPTLHAIERELPGRYMHWTGTLLWVEAEEREAFARSARRARERGVGVEVVDARAAMRLDPGVRIPEGETVFWEEASGWIDGPQLIATLIEAFQQCGGTLRADVPVTGFTVGADRVHALQLGGGELLTVDVVVNAAGSWATHAASLADVAVPLQLLPGRIFYTTPTEIAPGRVISAPTWTARPDTSGGYAIHWRGHGQDDRHGRNIISGDDLMDRVREILPALCDAKVARSATGVRAVPDGGPVIGALPWLPNLYFTVSHGGIGWGPLWGWLAAREILGGERVPELAAMRPERFYTESQPALMR